VGGDHTLVGDLKNRPQDLMSFFPLVRRILGIFHLVAKFKEGILYVIKTIWRWLAIAR